MVDKVLEFGAYQLDVGERLLRRGPQILALTPKAFDTLLVLLEHHGRLVTKDDLMQRLWPGSFVEESNLAQQVFTLRKILGDDPDGHPYIETVPKRGYRFRVVVREVEAVVAGASDDRDTGGKGANGPAGAKGQGGKGTFRAAAMGWVIAAAALSVVLYSGWRVSRPVAAPARSHAEAHQQYLKGRYFWNKRTEAGYAKAIEYFQQATETSPDYAPAYVGLADTYALLGSMTNAILPRHEAMPRARAYAERALSLDDSLAEAHTSLAFVQMHFDHDWAAAEREFRRAIDLNPTYVTAHHWYAYCLIAQTRVDEALREIRLAQDLDPLSLIINTDVAELLYYARRPDDAIRQAQKVLEMDPSFALAHRVLALAYEQKGMYKESLEELHTQVRLSGRADFALAELARGYALSGNRAEAEELRQELLALNPTNPGTSIGLAFLYTALGDKDQAFVWLQKSVRERMGVILIKVQPYFDSLRSDPRFATIERGMALSP